MHCKPVSCFVAAIAILLVASQAHAQYYNVDFVTLPNGPIELQLQNPSVTQVAGGYMLAGEAVDIGSKPYNNVKFLNEWMFDALPSGAPTAYTYQDGAPASGLWTSTDGISWSVPSPDGFLAANDVSPVPFTWTSTVIASAPPGFVAPTDLLPYVNIGTVFPGTPVPFTELISSNLPSNAQLDFVSSFVSTTPVPEPSSLVLLGIGAIGAIAVVGNRRRAQAKI